MPQEDLLLFQETAFPSAAFATYKKQLLRLSTDQEFPTSSNSPPYPSLYYASLGVEQKGFHLSQHVPQSFTLDSVAPSVFGSSADAQFAPVNWQSRLSVSTPEIRLTACTESNNNHSNNNTHSCISNGVKNPSWLPPSPSRSNGSLSPALTLSSPDNNTTSVPLSSSSHTQQQQHQFPVSSLNLFSNFGNRGDGMNYDELIFPSTSADMENMSLKHHFDSINSNNNNTASSNNSDFLFIPTTGFESSSTTTSSSSSYNPPLSLLSYLPLLFINGNDNISNNYHHHIDTFSSSSLSSVSPTCTLLTISPSDISPPDCFPETTPSLLSLLGTTSAATNDTKHHVAIQSSSSKDLVVEEKTVHQQQQQQLRVEEKQDVTVTTSQVEYEYDSLFDGSSDEEEDNVGQLVIKNPPVAGRHIHRIAEAVTDLMDLDEEEEEEEEKQDSSDDEFVSSSSSSSVARKRKSNTTVSKASRQSCPSSSIINYRQRNRKTSTASLPCKTTYLDNHSVNSGDQDEGGSCIVDDVSNLNEDFEIIRRGSIKFYICPVQDCRREFSRRFNLRTHIRTHNPHRSRPWTCPHPGCDATFVRSHDLERHSVVHNVEKPFTCTGCGVTFTRRDALKRHIEKKGCERGLEALEMSSKRRRKSN